MSKQFRMVLISISILAVLLVSAVHPLVARADDSTPPAPAVPASGDTSAPAAAASSQAPSSADSSAPAAVATQPPAAADDISAPGAVATQPPAAADDTSAPAAIATQPPSSASTSVAPADTSAPPASTSAAPADTSVAPASTSAAPADASATSASTSAAPASTLVGSVPTGTPVVVLDATGTAVPLATQTAAAIIKTGDPMWCPGSQTPGTSGCTSGYSTVTDLISALTGTGHPSPQAGTVYFESTYSNNDAIFDGSGSLSAWKTYALTLQGGWDGSTGVAGMSTFSVPITIENWNNNVTLNAINATDGITLENIQASGGQGSSINVSGNVTVEDSTFTGSSGDGLTVQTAGNSNITVHNVKSNHNSRNGAYLNNDSVLPAATGAIIISDSDFSNNGTGGVSDDGFGVEAISNGSITLTDVTADDNYDDGAYLDNCLDGGAGSCTNGASNNGISIDNSGISGGDGFNGNGNTGISADGYGNGLEAYSTESVTLTNVTADYNIYDGALLGYYNSDVPTYDEIGGDVFVTGGDFSHNNSAASNTDWPAGLEVHAYGSISLSGVTADDNTYNGGAYTYGAYLDNCLYDDVVSFACTGTGSSSITVDNTSGAEFNGNGYHKLGEGLDALSLGTIALTSVTADENGGDGAYLDNSSGSGDINIDYNSNTANGNSNFSGNNVNGLEAYSAGAITIYNVIADSNLNDDGAYLENDHGSSDITVTCSHLSNNSNYDIEAYSNGSVALNSDTYTSENTSLPLVIGSVSCGGGHGKSSGPVVGGAGPLPWNVVNAPDSGGQNNTLDCTQYVGTELVLPNGDHVLLPCPIGSTTGSSGSLSGLTGGNLPGKLDSKYTFVAGLDASVTPSLTGGMITVSFKIPAGKTGANFAILLWDGTKWVNVGGSINPPGYFSVTTSLTGDFVLVTQ